MIVIDDPKKPYKEICEKMGTTADIAEKWAKLMEETLEKGIIPDDIKKFFSDNYEKLERKKDEYRKNHLISGSLALMGKYWKHKELTTKVRVTDITNPKSKILQED